MRDAVAQLASCSSSSARCSAGTACALQPPEILLSEQLRVSICGVGVLPFSSASAASSAGVIPLHLARWSLSCSCLWLRFCSRCSGEHAQRRFLVACLCLRSVSRCTCSGESLQCPRSSLPVRWPLLVLTLPCERVVPAHRPCLICSTLGRNANSTQCGSYRDSGVLVIRSWPGSAGCDAYDW